MTLVGTIPRRKMTRRPHGTCPACGYVVMLRDDGTIGGHFGGSPVGCRSAGLAPVPDAPRRRQPLSSNEERFWAKVEKTDTCWLWTGTKPYGYGSFKTLEPSGAYRSWQSHRYAFELLVGPVPDGLQLDHLCRVKACVNPAHLEPVTAVENTRRALTAPSTINAAKTHCKWGHSFDERNTRVDPRTGERICRTCSRERERRYAQQRRQLKEPT